MQYITRILPLSSSINSISFCQDTSTLRVMLHDSRGFDCFNVSADMFEAISGKPSLLKQFIGRNRGPELNFLKCIEFNTNVNEQLRGLTIVPHPHYLTFVIPNLLSSLLVYSYCPRRQIIRETRPSGACFDYALTDKDHTLQILQKLAEGRFVCSLIDELDFTAVRYDFSFEFYQLLKRAIAKVSLVVDV